MPVSKLTEDDKGLEVELKNGTKVKFKNDGWIVEGIRLRFPDNFAYGACEEIAELLKRSMYVPTLGWMHVLTTHKPPAGNLQDHPKILAAVTGVEVKHPTIPGVGKPIRVYLTLACKGFQLYKELRALFREGLEMTVVPYGIVKEQTQDGVVSSLEVEYFLLEGEPANPSALPEGKKMSHTFKHEGTIFHYNPDLSGIVSIHNPQGRSIDVSGDALVAFMADRVRCERVARMEKELDEADDRELLGL